MAQPIITFMNGDSTAAISNWAIGEVNANSDSPTLDVSIWNNKGGAATVSDLRDVTVTCLDSDGGDVSKLVTEKWMKVLVDTTAEKDGGGAKIFSPIGGTTTRPVRAQGVLEADGNVIKGTLNDGTVANSSTNFAKATYKVSLPLNAPEGEHAFRIRTEGFYT
jgi:hypothetical protein